MRRFSALAALVLSASVASADPPELDAAVELMARGDFAGASTRLHVIARDNAVPEVREVALALARLADEYVRRGVRLEESSAPGAVAEPQDKLEAVSEDDAPTGGRASFVVTTTMASLYSGIVAADLFDVDDMKTGTALVMGTTAAGVVGSLYGTRDRTMSSGMADAWSLGLIAGAANSLLLSGPIGLYRADDNASEKVQSFVLASTWGTAAASLAIAHYTKPTRAQVSVVETFGVMGVTSTMLSLAIIRPDDLDGDLFLGLTAAGLDVGLGAGALFANRLDWSHSRARYVSLGAFLGALGGVGGSILAFGETNDPDTGRIAAGITLASLWGGFALSTYLTRDMAPDYRFRRHARRTAMVSPTLVNQSPGLALSGSF